MVKIDLIEFDYLIRLEKKKELKMIGFLSLDNWEDNEVIFINKGL